MRPAFLVIALLAIFQSGCATLFTGSTQTIELKAYPEDAETTLDGKPVANGPIEVDRADPHIIEVKKAGFETRRIQLKQDLNGWFFANILWGPFFWIGMLVDALTGSLQELSPSRVTVTLDPIDPNEPLVATAPPPSSSSSGTAVTVAPGGGPSLDPTKTQRGTGVGKKAPPPPAPPAPPKVVAPPPAPPAAPARKSPKRTMATAKQQKWVLAVMDTQLSGAKSTFDRTTLIALTDQIRVFLASRGMRVIDRSSQEAAMREVVQEQKRASYKQCVDSSCQIPLGKALAASHIMRSSVAKFGKACATNGELIDLRAEVTVAAGSARSGCTEEDLLYAAESLAEQLVTGSAK